MTSGRDQHMHAVGNELALWYLGSLVTIKASREQTGNAFGLLDELLPAGFATPMHIHQHEDESFYIIDGSVSFVCGAQQWTAGPGACIFLPRGIVHGFKARQPTHMLNLLTPGGFENFFKELGEPAQAPTLPPAGPPPDVAKLVSVAGKYHVEIVGPRLD